MICGACFNANSAQPGRVRRIRDFDDTDTHARLAGKTLNGIVKCSLDKATACSLKSVTPNRYGYTDHIEGPEEQPWAVVYNFSVNPTNNNMLLASAHTGELVRFHRLWPAQRKWVFCGYYSVHLLPQQGSVLLRYYNPETGQ